MFELKTVARIPAGCFSALLFKGTPFAVTLEHTFADGRPVIGNGAWRCIRGFYHRGGYPSYEILVPGHTLLKFHRGAIETHSKGCVLVGESFAELQGQPAIADSRGGFAEFMRLANGVKEFELAVSGR